MHGMGKGFFRYIMRLVSIILRMGIVHKRLDSGEAVMHGWFSFDKSDEKNSYYDRILDMETRISIPITVLTVTELTVSEEAAEGMTWFLDKNCPKKDCCLTLVSSNCTEHIACIFAKHARKTKAVQCVHSPVCSTRTRMPWKQVCLAWLVGMRYPKLAASMRFGA